MKYWISLLILINASSVFALEPILKTAFPEKSFENREGPRTDAILVWKDGKLVFEKYARGYTADKKHIMWSVSKSITSLLFAIAEHKGLVSRKDSICKFVKSVHPNKCVIKFENLLFFTSGLDWIEEYEKSNRILSASIVALLYGEGYPNMKKFVLGHKINNVPGLTWKYSSGDTLLLASLLPEIFGGKKSIHQVVQDELMTPLGIDDWTLELDLAGNPAGASYFYLKPKDLLKIGRLVLNKGLYEGQRLFSKTWMDYVSMPSEAFKRKRLDWSGKYIGGGSFWNNRYKEAGIEKAPWPGPEDTIMGLGHWGQYLVIIPSMNLVAVRTADNRDKVYQSETFVKSLVESFDEK